MILNHRALGYIHSDFAIFGGVGGVEGVGGGTFEAI